MRNVIYFKLKQAVIIMLRLDERTLGLVDMEHIPDKVISQVEPSKPEGHTQMMPSSLPPDWKHVPPFWQVVG